ncbi:MAG TPA: hypothetical protein VL172_11160, partial [Kofleriaceae bacterium]|nr:hypothetical protein [Kofleriaceae bacterium]
MKLRFIGYLALATGCSGNIMGDDDGADAGGGEATIAFTSPAPGATVTRDQHSDLGALIAPLPLAAETTGPIARVVFERDGVGPVAEVNAAPWTATLEVEQAGAVGLVAVGYDGNGAELARAEVAVTVVDPEVADCHGWLDMYGLTYELGPANDGVADPVTVTTPINGMIHRYVENTTPRATFFMDCSLALSLAKAAPILRKRGVVEMTDYGVYNYRCIGGVGTPPDCPNGISQHAYAKAIDITGLNTPDTTYTIVDDWVIDPDTEETCAAATESDKDQWLHETICELKAAGTWNIVLTPNYN